MKIFKYTIYLLLLFFLCISGCKTPEQRINKIAEKNGLLKIDTATAEVTLHEPEVNEKEEVTENFRDVQKFIDSVFNNVKKEMLTKSECKNIYHTHIANKTIYAGKNIYKEFSDGAKVSIYFDSSGVPVIHYYRPEKTKTKIVKVPYEKITTKPSEISKFWKIIILINAIVATIATLWTLKRLLKRIFLMRMK